MKPPPTSCPNCNSLQRFATHEREAEAGMVEIYVRCRMCHHERVVDRLTPGQLQSRRRFTRRRKALARKLNR